MKGPSVPSGGRMVDATMLRQTALALVTVGAILIMAMWPSISDLQFPDPDDELRLVQVRDWLSGQDWFDVTLYRVDAPGGGVPMHWSRLVDIPIAFFVLILTPLLGATGAETVAVVLVPLLTLGVILLLGARLAKQLLGPASVGFPLLTLAMTVPVLHQVRPLRIDHHGWQIALAMVAANGLFANSARRGGWVAGLALATWLTISLEGLPMVAIVMGVAALRWLRDRDPAWLVHTGAALAAGSAFLLVTTRLGQASAAFCDTLEIAHVLAFAFGAMGVAAVSRLRGHLAVQVVLLGAVAVGALAILLSIDRSCGGGGFGGLDPLVKSVWYDSVLEGLPIWYQDPAYMLQVLVPGVAALGAIVWLGTRQGADRRLWIDYGLLLAGALAVAVLVSRAGAVSAALGTVPLAALVAHWYAQVKAGEKPAGRLLRAVGLALVLVPTVPLTAKGALMPSTNTVNDGEVNLTACDYPAAAPVLGSLGRGEALALIDISPWVLANSDLSVIATGHHRGNAAMHTAIATFLGSPEEARQVLAQRGTRYVVMCVDLMEPDVYRKKAPEGFAAHLIEGKVPGWLREVPTDAGDAFHIWRVVDQAEIRQAGTSSPRH